jgi:putative transposase
MDMNSPPNPYRGFRFPAEIIAHAFWLYHCFSLSLRDVELILAARGVTFSYEMGWTAPTASASVCQSAGP